MADKPLRCFVLQHGANDPAVIAFKKSLKIAEEIVDVLVDVYPGASEYPIFVDFEGSYECQIM